ncbi:uncharacterized protein [Diadema antillarum]|uniref:uncharacterized protein n=1 Tax=Diadema antillarum TaxID=105358 RepID=UPI003A849CFA
MDGIETTKRPRVSSSEKKRKSRARQRRYRQNSNVISVSSKTANTLRKIGKENAVPSLHGVISLLILRYQQMSSSPGPGEAQYQNKYPQTSTPKGAKGTPSSAKSLPFFSSPFVPGIKRFSKLPDTEEPDWDSMSGVEELTGMDIEPETANSTTPPTQSLEPDIGSENRDLTQSSGKEAQEQANISVEALEIGDYLYPQEQISDHDSTSSWLPEDFHDIPPAQADCMGIVEEVFGDADDGGEDEEDEEEEEKEAEATRSGMHKKLDSAEEAQQCQMYLVTASIIKELAAAARPACKVCGGRTDVTVHPVGTSGHIEWACRRGHIDKYCLQETLNRTHVGDLKLGAAILLSGNNYQKVKFMADILGWHILSRRVFYAIQHHYVCPEVEATFGGMLQKNIHDVQGQEVVVCGDARNDSPGFSAQYCTYTTLDHSTKSILDVQFVDKRETGDKSPNMETLALVRAIEMVSSKGVKIAEVITDAHPVITALLKREYPEILHSWDVWHGAKNLGKKVAKASTTVRNQALKYWVKHITNHFWFCAETCGGDIDLFFNKWRGIVHHVCNTHEWLLTGGYGGQPRCEHGDLPERQEWLSPGTPPHDALVRIVLDKKFINTLVKFVNFRHTGELESLHNHILMYCAKRYSFGYAAYRARNLLAMIDYQEHKDRPMALDKEGAPKVRAKWSKHAGDWVLFKVRAPKNYNYLPGLMTRILQRRLSDSKPVHRAAEPLPTDPRKIRESLARHPQPSMEELLQKRKSRFT